SRSPCGPTRPAASDAAKAPAPFAATPSQRRKAACTPRAAASSRRCRREGTDPRSPARLPREHGTCTTVGPMTAEVAELIAALDQARKGVLNKLAGLTRGWLLIGSLG